MIKTPQDKLTGRQPTTISKFQQEIIPVLKRDTQKFRGGNI